MWLINEKIELVRKFLPRQDHSFTENSVAELESLIATAKQTYPRLKIDRELAQLQLWSQDFTSLDDVDVTEVIDITVDQVLTSALQALVNMARWDMLTKILEHAPKGCMELDTLFSLGELVSEEIVQRGIAAQAAVKPATIFRSNQVELQQVFKEYRDQLRDQASKNFEAATDTFTANLNLLIDASAAIDEYREGLRRQEIEREQAALQQQREREIQQKKAKVLEKYALIEIAAEISSNLPAAKVATLESLASMTPKGEPVILVVDREPSLDEASDLEALLGAGRKISVVTTTEVATQTDFEDAQVTVVPHSVPKIDWQELTLSEQESLAFLTTFPSALNEPNRILILSDQLELPTSGEWVVLARRMNVKQAKALAAASRRGATFALCTFEDFESDVSDWLPESVDVHVIDVNEFMLHASNFGGPNKRSGSPDGVEVWSDWSDRFELEVAPVAFIGSDEYDDEEAEGDVPEGYPWNLNGYGGIAVESIDEKDPLVWLAAQDADTSQESESVRSILLQQSAEFAQSMAESQGWEFDVFPQTLSFAMVEGVSPFGTRLSIRVNSAVNAEGEIITRIGMPIGYVRNVQMYLGYEPSGVFSAGWLGLKAQAAVLASIDVSAAEWFIKAERTLGVGQMLSGRGDSYTGPMIIRPWASVYRSFCFEDGGLSGWRGDEMSVVGRVPQGENPMCLYTGIELINGRHATTSVKFGLSAAAAMSVMADAVHMADGLIDELDIIPYAMP